MPEISVITASYNYQNYIKETIESVIKQTFTNWEMIIVDDGSKDNSVEVIKSYCEKDLRIKLYQHENGANRGLAETLKLGLSKASGKWVVFLESDDFITPDYMQEKLDIIQKYPQVTFLYNDVNLFGDEKRTQEMADGYLKNIHKQICNIQFPADINSELKKRNIIPTFSVVMVLKRVLADVDFDKCVIPYYLDYYLWTQLAGKKHKFYYIDKKLTNWRMSPTSYANNREDDTKMTYYRKVQLADNLSNGKYKLWHRLCFFRRIFFNIYISKKKIRMSVLGKRILYFDKT